MTRSGSPPGDVGAGSAGVASSRQDGTDEPDVWQQAADPHSCTASGCTPTARIAHESRMAQGLNYVGNDPVLLAFTAQILSRIASAEEGDTDDGRASRTGSQ